MKIAWENAKTQETLGNLSKHGLRCWHDVVIQGPKKGPKTSANPRDLPTCSAEGPIPNAPKRTFSRRSSSKGPIHRLEKVLTRDTPCRDCVVVLCDVGALLFPNSIWPRSVQRTMIQFHAHHLFLTLGNCANRHQFVIIESAYTNPVHAKHNGHQTLLQILLRLRSGYLRTCQRLFGVDPHTCCKIRTHPLFFFLPSVNHVHYNGLGLNICVPEACVATENVCRGHSTSKSFWPNSKWPKLNWPSPELAEVDLHNNQKEGTF